MHIVHKFSGFLLSAVATSFFVMSPAIAEKFSVGSKAKEFGFEEEEKALFSGKVVDVLCEVAGECTDNCGNGARQLGIVRDADNQLIFVLKNGQFSFNGAAEDLLPYCNKKVDVDGILVGEQEQSDAKFYMLQFIREEGAAEWNKANLWTGKWAERNPDVAEGKGPWFRRDPRVQKQIDATGYFGLGHEADEKYRAENQ